MFALRPVAYQKECERAENRSGHTGISKDTESTARPLTIVLRSMTVCLQIYFVLNISLIAVAAYGFPVLVV
jgi:hypothetical protein